MLVDGDFYDLVGDHDDHRFLQGLNRPGLGVLTGRGVIPASGVGGRGRESEPSMQIHATAIDELQQPDQQHNGNDDVDHCLDDRGDAGNLPDPVQDHPYDAEHNKGYEQ
jgi:hypothetical protein